MIEDDGVTPDQAWTIKATAVIRQDEVIVDYTGSSPQSTGPANQTWGVTASATYAALFNLYGPIPFNHGCYRPVSIIAPPGSFVNVEYPGSCVGGNSDTAPTTIDILLGALSEAAGKGCAADGGTFGLIGTDGVDPRNGRPFTYLHYDRSGWGARYNHDGNDAQSNKNGNGTNTPVEVLETRYPLECVEYSLNTEAAGKPGAGMYRGGFGTRRILRVACPTLTVSAHTNRNIVHPWGKAGGREGGNCRVLFRLKGQQDWKSAVELFGTRSPGKFSGVVLHEGDELMLALPGGGGYGPSARRDPVLVAADVRDGLYTAEEARHQFGVAVDPGTFIVDEAATAALRAAMEG